MFDSTKIKKRADIEEFFRLIRACSEIECTPHAFFRLSKKQRGILDLEELERILQKEVPFLAGIQYNNNYAIFYRYKNKILKMILKIIDRKINIVTFYFIQEWQIPKI